MTVKLTSYLTFKDNARQAMQRYQEIFGGQLEMVSMPEVMPGLGDEHAELVGHAYLAADGIEIMASDSAPGQDFTPPAGFSLALSGEDEAVLRGYWDALADGGTVMMPMEKAPWGDIFGMCQDRFGITWGVNVTQPA